MSERDKMIAGQLYFAIDPELAAAREAARSLTREYNSSSASTPDELSKRRSILKRLVGSLSDDDPPTIEPQFSMGTCQVLLPGSAALPAACPFRASTFTSAGMFT
jgi:hypothetical protein